MTDATKHIIAKEIHFFFKWLFIGVGIAIILFLPLIVAEFTNQVPHWLKDTTPVVAIIAILLPIWLYISRGIKWVVTWVNKWK